MINHVMLVNIQTRCRKQIIDKLFEECTETVEKMKHNENKHKCSSCTLYIVCCFQYFLQLTLGLLLFFIYSHWYLAKDATRVRFGTRAQTTI